MINRISPAPGAAASIAIFAATLVFLTAIGNWTGLEGDDLNSTIPMLNLKAALAGQVEIYRYDWQPLSYRLGAAVAEATNRLWPVFFLAPLAMALAVALLHRLLARLFRVPVWAFVCILLLSPEILYTGLYYNSTALGYPAAVGALALVLAPAAPARTEARRAAAIGALLAMALLFRLDFLLIAPAMLLLYWFRAGRILYPVAAGAVLGGLGLAALLGGLVRPDELYAGYRATAAELVARADDPGWNWHTKMFVASTALSPLGFVYYGLGSLALAWAAPAAERWRALAFVLALAPAFLPLRDLLSVKYLMPAYVFLPVLGGLIWLRAQTAFGQAARWFNGVLVAATGFLLVASVDIDNQRPYAQITVWTPREIGTHDGARSWGAYLPQMLRVRILRDPNAFMAQGTRLGQMLATALRDGPHKVIALTGEDTVFAASGTGWRHAVLALANRGYRPRVVSKGVMVVEMGDRALWLATMPDHLPEAVRADPAAVMLDGHDPELETRIRALAP